MLDGSLKAEILKICGCLVSERKVSLNKWKRWKENGIRDFKILFIVPHYQLKAVFSAFEKVTS